MRSPYPSYKPSGIEWLGDVPEHWEVKRLHRICQLAYGDSLPADSRQTGEFPVLGSNGTVGYHKKTNTLAPVIVIGRKGSHGRVNFSDSPTFAIDTTFFIDGRNTDAELRWLYFSLLCIELDEESMDSAVPGLSRQYAYKKYLALPPLREQRVIAAFLDQETARVDALVEKKKQLIERLAEYRTALITQTVTRGLPPDVAETEGFDPAPPLKSSGVEWLGDVPEHWDVRRLGHALSETVGGGTPSTANETYWADSDEEGIPWVAIADMSAGGEVTTTAKRITPLGYAATQLRQLPPRTIIYSMYASVGAVARLGISATTNQAILGLLPRKRFDSSYLYWWLNGIRKIVLAMTRDNTQSNLNAETVCKIPLAVPPLSEQRAIAAFLDSQTECINALSGQVEAAIERLQEYRTALITAAVTGKIDVSDWEPVETGASA